MSDPALSLVLPVHNERESLPELQAQISGVAQAHGLAIEVIYVDDGSRDNSWQVIQELAARDPRYPVIIAARAVTAGGAKP